MDDLKINATPPPVKRVSPNKRKLAYENVVMENAFYTFYILPIRWTAKSNMWLRRIVLN